MDLNAFRRVLFRSDASSDIGLGHVMRDLVLAKRLESDTICFATRDLIGNIDHKIIEEGYSVCTLTDDTAETLLKQIRLYRPDLLIIDHYGIGIEIEKRIKKETSTTLMVIDDTYEAHHCDILLNGNLYASANAYTGKVPSHCRLYCGPSYQLLRDEFKTTLPIKREARTKPSRVYVAMGGSDHSGLNPKILKVLRSFTDLDIDIVTTTSNRSLARLRETVRREKNITLHVDSKEIAKLLVQADVAIITPSQTANEVAAMRVPFIAIKTADNQRLMHRHLLRNRMLSLDRFDAKRVYNMLMTIRKKHRLYRFRLQQMLQDA